MNVGLKIENFTFDRPLGEPNLEWNQKDTFHTHREQRENGEIVWFGYETNWKKEINSNWKKLSVNINAIPLEEYLPEIIYGEDRLIWVDCETPIYEKLYLEQFKK